MQYYSHFVVIAVMLSKLAARWQVVSTRLLFHQYVLNIKLYQSLLSRGKLQGVGMGVICNAEDAAVESFLGMCIQVRPG